MTSHRTFKAFVQHKLLTMVIAMTTASTTTRTNKMATLPEILRTDSMPLMEMANLFPEDTGIPGTIFISTKMGQYGCRIKYYPNINDQSKSFVVTIPGYGIVEDSTGTTVKSKIRKQVIAFAILNQQDLLTFWNSGHTMRKQQSRALIDGLRPITDNATKSLVKLKIQQTPTQLELQ
jgi:hypothetical protein